MSKPTPKTALAATQRWRASHKQHTREYSRQWKLANPEKVRAQGLNKRRNRPDAVMLYQARSRAKQKGLMCTLVLADIPAMPEFCPVFPWIKLERHIGTGLHDNSPSLDRINNALGYTPGNVRIVSDRANRCKRDMSWKEIQALWEDSCQK